VIIKHLYLYLPIKDSEIIAVFIESNWKELHHKKLRPVDYTQHLWELKISLHPDVLNSNTTFQFVVEKNETHMFLSSKRVQMVDHHVLNSSPVQRTFWKKVSSEGVLDHVQHIMQHCGTNIKDSILELESLLAEMGTTLNIREKLLVLNNLVKANTFTNSGHSLLFVVFVGKMECYSFIETSDDNLVTKLFQTLCMLKKNDLPSTCIRCLHKLSYFIFQKKFKAEFCLVLWMSYMFPFQTEATFLEEVNRFVSEKKPVANNDKKSMEMALNICTKVRDRILKKESDKGPEFLFTLLRNLLLAIAMKVYSQLFENRPELFDLEHKIVDILVTRIQTTASEHVSTQDISNLSLLWKHARMESYASLLTAGFEKHFLALIGKTRSFSENYQAFCEDELLFVDGPNKEALLQIIAKSHIREIHEYMKTLTQGKKYLTLTSEVIEKWFETALNKYTSSGLSSQPIASMYSTLCDAVSLQQDGNNADLISRLENKLYSMKIKYLSPAPLAKMADPIFSATGHTKLAQEVFQHHLERLLREKYGSDDPKDILISICGRDLWVNSDWQASLVSILLDLNALKDGWSTQETILTMLTHQNFWKAMMKVQGNMGRKIKMHQSYIAASECISSLRKSLNDMTVTVEFLQKIKSEDRMFQVASFLADDDLQGDHYHVILKDCYASVMKQRGTVGLVKSILGIITKYIPEAGRLGLLTVEEKVHAVSESLKAGNITIKQLKQMLWQPYDSVPSICERLEIPCKSNVFWKVCIENRIGKDNAEMVVESEGSNVEEETERQDDAHNIVVDRDCIPDCEGLMLLKDLCGKGCDLYKKAWDNFYQGSDLLISAVQDMFMHGVNIPEEIGYIEEFEEKALNSLSKTALLHYWDLRKYKHTVKAMKNSLAAFRIDTVDEEFRNAIQAFEDLAKGDAGRVTLFQVHDAVKTVQKASCMLSEDAVDLLNVLGMSSSLIDFLSDIVDEDIRNLIDAVEEVSEKYVKESTVSGLIEVKRFLHTFLIKDSPLRQNQDVFFRVFAEKFQEMVLKDAVLKTTDCYENLHNLKSLYNNVANRSERTREIIRNIIEIGNFNLSLKHHECMLTVSYRQKESISTYSKTSLVDLRSRALLLMNTARKENAENEEEKQEYLGKYVNYIDLALEIAELCTSLYVAGHFKFTKFDEQVQPDQLEECRSKLKEELIAWQRDIMQCREKYYYMNFLLGGQIQTWYNYIQTESLEDKMAADTFLKFIHPEACIELVCKYFTKLKSDVSNQDVLMNMGIALEKACKSLMPVRQLNELSIASLHITESVQKGKLHIISLDEDSKLVVRTVLSLYQNNAQAMPEAHKILFCRRETTWDEIDLLLKRCLGASKCARGDSLFCLANVERLSNEYQFQLVDALRKLPKDGTFLLAIIFRGAEHHPFLHEFSDCVTRIHPMTEASLQMCLQNECPEIFTVTSDVPGLGKTETIKKHAHKIHKKCVTLHVSGPLSKDILVERLSKLKIKDDVVLHIDIGNTPDTEELDTLLFELFILHYVSAYTTSVFLCTSLVCVEIANTMNNTLSNSLHIATSFKRKHIRWEGFKSFQVSSDLHSPVQVVCHYLNAVEDGTLEKKDVIFKGTKASRPLPLEKCIFLLQNYFRMNEDDISYTLINSFVRVLADQLKKLSCSGYFKISNLSLMLGRKSKQSVKTDLVKAMVDVSVDFAARSIKGCRDSQKSTAAISSGSTNMATSLAARVEGMIRWEDSNHLVFLFHSQDVQTLSVLYRDISHVPSHINTLFESQMKKKLPDFAKMDQGDLQDILQKVARSNQSCIPKKDLQEMAKYYALTPDNLLKMVLIMLRIRAHIPVIVMGETGCGKTSLIQYLSKISDVDFNVKTIHAGIEEEDIIQNIEDINQKALQLIKTKQQVWLFLDEINTSDHIWLLSDIICHHSCLGRKLAPNLVLMAACNPYKLRSESSIHTAGLDDKARTDELSRLLYRVHPLPETMVDYVWDFGSLSKADERMYIEQMVCGKLGFSTEKEMLLVDALVISQEFIRKKEGLTCCVSLRDVRRCKDLAVWFKEKFLDKKKKLKSFNYKRVYSRSEIEIRSIILALAHCYHSRLIDSKTRHEYSEDLSGAFIKHDESEYREDKIKAIIREEQQDILDRMELPPGVAKNTALQENVFVILVCILNRIPIFVVGKPGCSKSLSMQVIRSNLRGPDSKDELFKLLPQLYCVSFQGSESSTSDGIIKVFEKAQKYQESNSQEDVLSVVILDEIGLAEISRFNPLKVLHSLLEPFGKPCPDVAVVGISNWALDASKMNRAIHLSRPDMDEEELYMTGESISHSYTKSSEANMSGIISARERDLNISQELKAIARGYFEFISNQRFKNFFGLRDYYSLVKYFARELAHMTDYAINKDVKGKIIWRGIQRNFGGLPSEMGLLKTCFEKHISALLNMSGQESIPILDLIKENIDDRTARHLLLITTGDSVLGILEKQLKDQGREYMTIFGSKFEEDLTDDYSYRILSRIILCMEQGLVLILKDLETVYGSLYDMLNQNYTIVGNKKNCRIALGPYSNPMCYVHDDFKCIVLVEESELDHSDPPFLNRFEKQNLQYSEILGEENQMVVSELKHWVSTVSIISGRHFSTEDIIPIYSRDMIPSLVLHASSKLPLECQTVERKVEESKCTLLQVVKPEAIVRLGMSDYGKNCSNEEVENVQQSYFQMQIHDGLEHFLKVEIGTGRECVGNMIIVFTNSNIHTDLKKIVPDFKCQVEKLGAFKSEKQLTMQMEQFWHSSDRELLFLQCKADTDGTHILLSKSIIEKLQADYIRRDMPPKHVCLIVHLGRRTEEAKTVPQIDFLAKWKLVMLDSLDRPKTRLPELLRWNLLETIEVKRPLNDYIKEQLFAAFACIRYGTVGRSINSISQIITEICNSSEFLSYLEGAVLQWIDSNYSCDADMDSWQMQVACDTNALYTASSFIEALERYILSIIFDPLAMVIYELEKQNLLDSFFVSDLFSKNRRCMWYEVFHDKKMFTIVDTPLPKGPECYALSTPVIKLHMPFSKLCFERIEEERDYFSELLRSTLLKYEADEVEELDNEVVKGLCYRFSDIISCKLGELSRLEYENCQMDYIHDFCTLTVAKLSPEDITDEKINVMYWLLPQRSRLPDFSLNDVCTFVHTAYWTNFRLIMAEFTFIETCRELVDIKGVLHEIFRRTEEDMEEYSVQLYQKERVLDKIEHEESLMISNITSGSFEDCSSNHETNTRKENYSQIDDLLSVTEKQRNERFITVPCHEYLEQQGEPFYVGESEVEFEIGNQNNSTEPVLHTDIGQNNRVETVCMSDVGDQDEDGCRNVLTVLANAERGTGEDAEDKSKSNSRMFKVNLFETHDLSFTHESVDTVLQKVDNLDIENHTGTLETNDAVSNLLNERRTSDWIRDGDFMQTTSSSLKEFEIGDLCIEKSLEGTRRLKDGSKERDCSSNHESESDSKESVEIDDKHINEITVPGLGSFEKHEEPSFAGVEIVLEKEAGDFYWKTDDINNCTEFVLDSDNEQNNGIEVACRSDVGYEDEEGCRRNVQVAMAHARRGRSDLDVGDSNQRLFKESSSERPELCLTWGSVDRVVKQEETLCKKNEVTLNTVSDTLSEFLNEGRASENNRDDAMMQIISSSVQDPDVFETCIEETIEGITSLKTRLKEKDCSNNQESGSESEESTQIDKEFNIIEKQTNEIGFDTVPGHGQCGETSLAGEVEVPEMGAVDHYGKNDNSIHHDLHGVKEQNNRIEVYTSQLGCQDEDEYRRNMQATLADAQKDSSELVEPLNVSESYTRMFKETSFERQDICLTEESVDTALKMEETSYRENEVTVEDISESLNEGMAASGWIRNSSMMQTISNSLNEPEVEDENIPKAFVSVNIEEGHKEMDFKTLLVEKLCRKILPATNTFKSDIGIEMWNRKVQSILSLAGRVSKDCSVLYELRFCSDLTSLVLIPYKMGSYWLVQLGNLLQRDLAMDTEEFMEKISEMLIFLRSNNVTIQDQQKIFSQYILRCLQGYEDSNVVDWFLHMLESSVVPDCKLSYLKSPLYYACFTETGGNVSQSIFCQILDSDPDEASQLLEESRFLSSLNSSIENQLETFQHNIPLAILLVDVFEQEIFHSLHPDIATLMTETAVERLLKVERIMFEEKFSLKQIIAIAYYRNFVKILGDTLLEDPGLSPSNLQKVDACLTGNEKDKKEDKRWSLQLFFLKVLKSSLRFAEFHKVCQILSSKLTFMSSLLKCKSLMNSTDNSPLALYNINFHTDVKNAFESNNTELKLFIMKAVSDCDQMLSLHSVLVQQFFLKRTLMELEDSERIRATEVEELCKECRVDEYNFRLIQFHLGKNDYQMIHDLNLNLHQGSKESDMQIASFVIELASLALSSRIKSTNMFIKCFLQPEEISGIFMPWMEVKEFTNMSSLTTTKTFVGRCTSHHRFAYVKEDILISQCPLCSGPIVEDNASTVQTAFRSFSEIDELVSGTALSTISQHLLQMIVHGLLIASLAAGYSKCDQISCFLQRTEGKDVAQYLYQRVESAFRYLEKVMGIKQTDLDYFMHAALSRTRAHVWETYPTFTEEYERNSWEKEFSSIVSSLVDERFMAVHQGKRLVMALHLLDKTAIEYQIEETDEVGWNPCLFRLTLEPSLDNLSFELHQENNADSFPFLALVLKALPQLELIQHIKPLISWHKACVTYASYHKKKADCLKSDYTVSTFIHEENDPKQRSLLKQKFDSCKRAWEAIRENAGSLKELPAMDRLHDLSKLENCLILDQSSCMYKVIEFLALIQNSFLDEALTLSITSYVPALHFLQKNSSCACLPCIPAADVQKDQIINFKWSERYLKFSQCNIQYGQGREICYDFRTIEMELGNSLLLGKGYLLLAECFPRIVFTDELYKTYILMIQELKDVLPQQKLASDIESGLKSRKERDPKLVADFLNHLGIIISLLRRTGGKPETPLAEFVDNWSCVLTRPFPKQVLPSPDNSIQLCHIVELNELLEELNADGVIDSLEDEYRVPLEGSSLIFIEGFLSTSVLIAEVVLKAEKRFVHRCLLHREVAPMDSLLDHLRDQYFWPVGSVKNGCLQVGSHKILLSDLFAREVRVQHITSYLQFLAGKIEYLKSKDLRISHSPSTQSTPGKTISKSLAKKKLKRRFNLET
ncbi:hypothetical protein ACJMK2_016631, partial [Sinanodonta woodiana]